MPTVPNFVGPSYNLDDKAASVQRTINMVPVPLEAGNERSPWVFADAPGLVVWSSSGGCVHYFTDTFTGAALSNELLLHSPDVSPDGFSYPETGDITGIGLDGMGFAIPGGRSGNNVSISRSSSTFGGAWDPIEIGSSTFSIEIVALLTEATS